MAGGCLDRRGGARHPLRPIHAAYNNIRTTITMSERKSGFWSNVVVIVYAALIAIGFRTFLFEPFNIPSGSMIPTLQVGDYLFVSKYAYGYSHFSLPFAPDLFSGRIFGSLPHRGDVVVFRLPTDTSTSYIKRVIGLPGDTVQMREGHLFINGTEVPRKEHGVYTIEGEGSSPVPEEDKLYVEDLPGASGQGGVDHLILKRSDHEMLDNTPEFKVPAGHFFAMGDNRDNSQDSRVMSVVGFVPIENLIGRAEFIFFSVHATAPWYQVWEWPLEIRWNRLFRSIH
ncbi:Signal peptidase I [Granulibacter bethesdensis]|nr:Signal peptidase I [Granulibacter bethesdensis]